jgi:cell division protein FtsW (lipid II flippase)
MNILKSSASKESSPPRNLELRAMIFVSVLLLGGLALVYGVKSGRPQPFAELPSKMTVDNKKDPAKIPEIINLNEIEDRETLALYLNVFNKEADRDFAAEKLYHEISQNRGEIASVGFLTSVHVSREDIEINNDLDHYKSALETAVRRAEARRNRSWNPITWIMSLIRTPDTTIRVRVLNGLGSMKISFIVRTPGEFLTSLMIWSLFFFGSFFGLHLYWRIRRFEGDGLILPPIFLLCGIGFLMMIGMRDPLRDSLDFTDFTVGVGAGCAVMLIITSLDYHNIALRFQQASPKYAYWLITYAPIFLAILLSLILIMFGLSPGTSDARINLNLGLFSFQPSEIIKILFAFFVASYFGERWEYFRYLERKIGFFSFPRFWDLAIVTGAVGFLLTLFFLQKDLGPALMMAGLFLILFAVVRRRIGLSVGGLLCLVAGYVFNYFIRISETAADRLEIWLNPWDTKVPGGDQIVQSLWSFATGGITGTGIGLGDPYFAPAHHTDLILSSVGEELGYVGIVLIFVTYTLLFYRCYVIARNAFSPFAYFLVLGLGVINALQMLFISAGVLGLIPLSGVVTPFLSDGMTSMVCNFAAFGMILAVSAEKGSPTEKLIEPTRYIAYGYIGIVVIILFNAFLIQLWNSNAILVRGVLSPVRDEVVNGNRITGIRRFSYNPRIYLAKRELRFGTIYDRNGIPLASSDWEELNKFAAEYESLGIMISEICKKGVRCYPFGNQTFHLLGDALTEKDWAASNTSFVERDYQKVIRGYDDHAEVQKIKVKQLVEERDEGGRRVIDPMTKKVKIKENEIEFSIEKKDYLELLPLIHNRYNPINIRANLMKFKNRNIQTSIDIRLQVRLTEIMKTELERQRLRRGALVVLDPKTGDLMASVSLPLPADQTDTGGENFEPPDEEIEKAASLNRARFGSYPPGSTFKIVTGMAALRRDSNAAGRQFSCIRLADGRVGSIVRDRPVKDDIQDKTPHGRIAFRDGLKYSCNGFFAHLGTDLAGAVELHRTAQLFEIKSALPNTATELNKYLPQSSFGQGEIVASPFQIARVSATIANGGLMESGRWVIDENNERSKEAIRIVSAEQAAVIGEAMRLVVTDGTGRVLAGNPVAIAGKTGTAENPAGRSHSWFTGFAPFNGSSEQIAFAVIVEHGGYGGGIAAKIAGDIVTTAEEIGVIR